MYIHGGRNSYQLFDDIFVYDLGKLQLFFFRNLFLVYCVARRTWGCVEVAGNVAPTPRCSHCAIVLPTHNKKIIIVGGMSPEILSEVWIFNVGMCQESGEVFGFQS